MRHWFARHLYLAEFALAAFARRRARSLVLLTVYLLIVFALASVMLFSSAVRRDATATLIAAPEITVQRISAGRHALIEAEAVAALAAIRGVKQVEGRLWGYFFDNVSGANYTLMADGGPQAGQLAPGQAIIGEGVARLRGFRAGGELFLIQPDTSWFRAKIIEILNPDTAAWTSDLIVLHPDDFRTFFGLPDDMFTDISLSVRNPGEIDTIVAKGYRALPQARFVTRADLERTYQALFDWREGLLLAFVLMSVVAFAILAWDKAASLGAEEKREVGLLKAVGWDTADVMTMRFWEGAFTSLIAFFGGFILAYVHVFVFGATLLVPVLRGWSALYPDFTPTPHIDGLQVFTLFLLAVIPYMAASIVPVWRTATTDPDEVMRA